VTVLAAAAEKAGGVDVICLPHGYDAVDLCGLLAWRLDAVAVTSVSGVRAGENDLTVLRPAHGGKLVAELCVPAERALVLTVARGAAPASGPGVEPPPSSPSLELRALELDPALGCSLPDREVLAFEDAGASSALGQAERIVAVGRGLGGPEHLPVARRLAAALRAEVAGSRPVIDAGWLPADRQVGSSGQTVSPKLYVALGISGAAQHLEGMSGARCVVAVNSDPEAPIFRAARYGVVADLHSFVPELSAALEEGEGAQAGRPRDDGGAEQRSSR
jgi:electron transfer flavoprotein alpha subunit